jgi:hypothetical protein
MSFDNFATQSAMSYDSLGKVYIGFATFSSPGTFVWRANCDGDIGNDTFTIAGAACTDADGDGYGQGCALGADCNDNNASIRPSASEVCFNAVDDNCNGQTDEGCNRPPVLAAIGNKQVNETQTLAFYVECN